LAADKVTWSMIGTGTDRGTDAVSPSLAIGATPGMRYAKAWRIPTPRIGLRGAVTLCILSSNTWNLEGVYIADATPWATVTTLTTSFAAVRMASVSSMAGSICHGAHGTTCVASSAGSRSPRARCQAPTQPLSASVDGRDALDLPEERPHRPAPAPRARGAQTPAPACSSRAQSSSRTCPASGM
jgi:hypothetical protein